MSNIYTITVGTKFHLDHLGLRLYIVGLFSGKLVYQDTYHDGYNHYNTYAYEFPSEDACKACRSFICGPLRAFLDSEDPVTVNLYTQAITTVKSLIKLVNASGYTFELLRSFIKQYTK